MFPEIGNKVVREFLFFASYKLVMYELIKFYYESLIAVMETYIIDDIVRQLC